jgi:hypothetical protein
MPSYSSKRPDGLKPFEFDMDPGEDGNGAAHFVCAGDMPLLDLVEVMRMSDYDIRHPQVMAVVGDFLAGVMGAEEYERFRRHCREHSTQPDTIAEITRDMIGHYSARPTVRSGRSASGPPRTTPTSRAGSSSPASPGAKPAVRGKRSAS